ncbi:putative G-protein coupled receptor No18 [Brevipalpus obovatus]|uniref:putative G-protein coupled receptor No18 n=1 Tax=Brevipalpus obovatus TaxID=246614 RepID=UPI003D9F6C68
MKPEEIDTFEESLESFDNFTHDAYPHFHEAGNFWLDFFSASVCFEIIIGNLLVIITAFRYKCFGSKSTNRYIISLAVSDSMIGFFVIPLNMFNLAKYDLLLRFQEASFISSIFNLTVISMDRYLAIRHPIRYSRELTARKINLNIVIIWVVTFVLVEIPVVVDFLCSHSYADYDPETFHICDFLHGDEIFLITFIFAFYIPLIMMSVMSYRVYKLALESLTAQEQRRRQRLSSKVNSRPDDRDVQRNRDESAKLTALIHHNKLSFTLGLIMAVFVITWAPFFVISPIVILCSECQENFARAHHLAIWLGILNSGMNPIIHFLVSRKFRRALYILFCGPCVGDKFKSHQHSATVTTKYTTAN